MAERKHCNHSASARQSKSLMNKQVWMRGPAADGTEGTDGTDGHGSPSSYRSHTPPLPEHSPQAARPTPGGQGGHRTCQGWFALLTNPVIIRNGLQEGWTGRSSVVLLPGSHPQVTQWHTRGNMPTRVPSRSPPGPLRPARSNSISWILRLIFLVGSSSVVRTMWTCCG